MANFKLSPTNKPQLRLNKIKLTIWQRAIYNTVGSNQKKHILSKTIKHLDNYFEGIFWINENHKVSATLYIDNNGTSTISSLHSLKNKNNQERKWEQIEVVFGYINCNRTSKTFSIKLYETFQILQSNGALTKYKYQSSNCFISEKFDSDINSIKYNSIMLNSTVLSNWIPVTGFKENTDQSNNDVFIINQIYEQPKPIELFNSEELNIYLFFRAYSGSPNERKSYIREEVYLNIETIDSHHIKDLYLTKSMIERLISILLFTPFNSSNIEFKSTSGDYYKALNINKELRKGYHNSLDFMVFKENSEDIFTKWFEKQDSLNLFINNFFSVYGQNGVMIENKFLTYISVLENFHANNITRNCFLKNRLIYLLENSSIREHINNISLYAEKLKITRNYYAHLEERHQENSLTIDEIIRANQLIEIIIHEILLKEIGIDEYPITRTILEITEKINESLD